MWVFVGHAILKPDSEYRLGSTDCGCVNSTVSFAWNASLCAQLPPPEWTDYPAPVWIGLDKLYALSTLMYSAIGTLTLIAVAIPISWLTGGSSVCADNPRLSYWRSRLERRKVDISGNAIWSRNSS